MARPKKKHRILVVEDDRISRKLIVHILESVGYEVLETGEGRDALHIVEMCPPTAMIVDVMLPDMQGTQLVEELSQNPECRFVKAIFLTGILANKDRKKSYFFNIEGVKYKALSKPVRKKELLRQLEQAVEESVQEQKLASEEAEEAKRLAAEARLNANSKSNGGEVIDLNCIESRSETSLW